MIIIYVNGNYEKSISLSNQQETKNNILGSSETYTRSFSEFTFDSAKPSHINDYDINFLDWFIGFVEGGGSFSIDYKTSRISFIITQKDPKVLYYIKKNIGFGKIFLCKDSYYRYKVSKFINLQYLIQIFSGKLLLKKTNLKYVAWVKYFIKYYKLNTNLIIKFNLVNLDLNNAWFSGFIDAEGCFDCYKRAKRISYRMRFSIKQKDEFFLFNKLPYSWNLLEKKGKVGFISKNKNIFIFTIDSIVWLKYLLIYLKKFPLKSNKNIVYSKWLVLYRILLDGCRGINYETIVKIAQNINKFENEDKVQN